MHPAASVILFTTSTGFGYGLLIWLSIALNLSPQINYSAMQIILIIGIALLLISFGLLSSLWHLGHPERAWRAMSQWRTSWLSREGVFAVLVYPVALLMGISVYFDWMMCVSLLSIIVALLSIVTVYCTAMIYASLKTIPAWHNRWTIFGYPLYSLSTGGVLFYFINSLFMNLELSISAMQLLNSLLLCFIFIAFCNKITYFRYLRNNADKYTKEMAIGLKGTITPLDPPHSSANYLMKEMGFTIARKNAHILRPIALLASYVLPFLLLCLQFTNLYSSIPILLITLALFSCMIGIVCERYLFFAEAKHVVTLYYR